MEARSRKFREAGVVPPVDEPLLRFIVHHVVKKATGISPDVHRVNVVRGERRREERLVEVRLAGLDS